MDVVRAILNAPLSATEGQGAMRGQMLSPRVRIISARRLPATAR
jgi:peptidyl-prolyl cis-trans isomerase A (cyclophilin A)